MQMAINTINSYNNVTQPRRVNRAFKALLDLDEKFEEKINQTLAEARDQNNNYSQIQNEAIRSLDLSAQKSLHEFQKSQARLNASIVYA